jgi:hypothetical protein
VPAVLPLPPRTHSPERKVNVIGNHKKCLRFDSVVTKEPLDGVTAQIHERHWFSQHYTRLKATPPRHQRFERTCFEHQPKANGN